MTKNLVSNERVKSWLHVCSRKQHSLLYFDDISIIPFGRSGRVTSHHLYNYTFQTFLPTPDYFALFSCPNLASVKRRHPRSILANTAEAIWYMLRRTAPNANLLWQYFDNVVINYNSVTIFPECKIRKQIAKLHKLAYLINDRTWKPFIIYQIRHNYAAQDAGSLTSTTAL